MNWITVVTHVQTQSPRSLPEMIGFNLAWIKLGASVAIVAPVIAYIVLAFINTTLRLHVKLN